MRLKGTTRRKRCQLYHVPFRSFNNKETSNVMCTQPLRRPNHRITFEELAPVIGRWWDDGRFVAHDGLHGGLESGAAVLGIDVELGQVPRLGGPPVAVRQRAQTLQALGHDRRETPLAGQIRDQEYIFRSAHLRLNQCQISHHFLVEKRKQY